MSQHTISSLAAGAVDTPIEELLGSMWVQMAVTLFLAGCSLYAYKTFHSIIIDALNKSWFTAILVCVIVAVGSTMWKPEVLFGEFGLTMMDTIKSVTWNKIEPWWGMANNVTTKTQILKAMQKHLED